MAGGARYDTRGVLHRRAAEGRFQITRRPPSGDLAWIADYHWILTWDLRDRAPHRQRVLTHPSVNMTFTTGGRARVVGVVRGVFTETIEGRGRVVGVRFRPGGFRSFLDGPVSAITDRRLRVEEIFGPPGRALAGAVLAEPAADEAVALVEGFVRSRAPARPDPAAVEAAGVVDRIAADPCLLRVRDLAAATGIGVRRLQRLFAEYVGVSPKWVIRRYRMQEAADRVAVGTEIDWAALAADLGYADQAHFVRDFSATIGTTPARYARSDGDGAAPDGVGAP